VANMDKKQGTGQNAFKFLIAATAITLAVNIIFWLLPASFNKTIYGTIQFVWPALGMLLLMGIHFNSADKNTKFIARAFGIALAPWTATFVLWYIVLPQAYNSDMAYYVSGFGFLLSYVILAYGLIRLKRSRQWYIDPSTDFFINVITAMAIVGVSAFILGSISPGSARLPDVLILYLYLLVDIVIMSYIVKLLYMSLGDDLKYIVLVIGEFVFINSLADLIYELRWLFSMEYVFSVMSVQVTDLIYNVSLIFMVAALMMYGSRFKTRAMDEVNKKLSDTKHLVDSVVMQSPDAICICDSNGNVVLVNDALLELFESLRSGIPCRFNILDHMSGLGDWTGPFASKLRSGEAAFMPGVSLKLPGDNSRQAEVSVKAFPVLGSDNNISSYVFTIVDITEWLRIEKDLLESKKQAELYVDLMAHDINNLNQVALGFLELAEDKMLTEGKLDAGQIELLHKPIESLANSSRLIDNVKKLQKEKSGQLGARLMDVDEVLSGVKKQYESVPGRVVSIDYQNGCGCHVMANDLLKEVFSNLVGNAIKHSSGPVEISIISNCVIEDGEKFCRINVEDNGPGIPDRMKRQIFDRLNNGILPRGKGLGLYLASTLVSDYDGRIWVEDRVPGDHTKGSRFVVLLPAH
jgi:signal transduction histidine kinase